MESNDVDVLGYFIGNLYRQSRCSRNICFNAYSFLGKFTFSALCRFILGIYKHSLFNGSRIVLVNLWHFWLLESFFMGWESWHESGVESNNYYGGQLTAISGRATWLSAKLEAKFAWMCERANCRCLGRVEETTMRFCCRCCLSVLLD